MKSVLINLLFCFSHTNLSEKAPQHLDLLAADHAPTKTKKTNKINGATKLKSTFDRIPKNIFFWMAIGKITPQANWASFQETTCWCHSTVPAAAVVAVGKWAISIEVVLLHFHPKQEVRRQQALSSAGTEQFIKEPMLWSKASSNALRSITTLFCWHTSTEHHEAASRPLAGPGDPTFRWHDHPSTRWRRLSGRYQLRAKSFNSCQNPPPPARVQPIKAESVIKSKNTLQLKICNVDTPLLSIIARSFVHGPHGKLITLTEELLTYHRPQYFITK